MVLSSALVYSTCAPVSVWGTVSSLVGSPSPRSFCLEAEYWTAGTTQDSDSDSDGYALLTESHGKTTGPGALK